MKTPHRKVPLGGWVLLVVVALSLVLGGQYATEQSLDPETLRLGAFASALAGSTDTPLLTHALLALPVLGLLAFALVRRQVVQVPAPTVSPASSTPCTGASASRCCRSG